MEMEVHILHLEDDTSDAEFVARMLNGSDLKCRITRIKTRRHFEDAIQAASFDLILSDYTLPSFDGLSALRLARNSCPHTPFIFVSGTIGEERAIESLREGAVDYVIKDSMGRLVPAIKRALADATTEQKRRTAEEKLREQATVLDQAQDAISINDLNQTITYWNKSAERLYGWPAQDAVGQNANEILFQGELTAPRAAFKSLIRKGEWKGELHQVTKSGREIIVESRWTLLRDPKGEPKSILVINTDITEKRQIEAQLLRTQRMESIGALAGGIAHDFNNALTPVLVALAYMKDEPIGEQAKQLLNVAQTSARRSLEMVKQILTFSRGTDGTMSETDLRSLIEEMVKFIRETFPDSVKIECSVPDQIDAVSGNSTQLHQVLMNLCINARDAMPDGGTLRIEASNVALHEASLNNHTLSPGPYVLLAVRDSGCGMPVEVMAQIFEPFFSTKAVDKGTGLGLSTVMGIVKTHDGFVDVASKPGQGSIFRVYLPAIKRLS